MHKARYNSLCLDLSLQPTGPLLIKSGQFAADPSLPDMQFVRTFRAGAGETIYIPGSSLKGVVRSFVEKALRTLDANCPPGPADDKSWRWACASFEAKKEERKDKSKWNCPQFLNELAEERHKELQSCEIYRYSCGACRTFGHTRLRGRASFTDLYPESDVKTETRYGVAISRLTHAVAQGPFEMEVVVAGSFSGQLVLENYELWQLGLVAAAIEAMNQGLLKLGFGKNRGFGHVRLQVKQAMIDEVVPLGQSTAIRGLVSFVDEQARQSYRLFGPELLTGLPEPQTRELGGFYERRMYDAAGWQAISAKAIAALQAGG
jgi:CRISPR-associated RAMP protein (TIGR02581 family)